MKKILTLIFLFSQVSFGQNVYFNILKEKTERNNSGIITLYVEIINESKKDIIMLKPAIDFRQKFMHYYFDLLKCDETADLYYAAIEFKLFKYEYNDLLKIKSKSKKIIKIRHWSSQDTLACNSSEFEVKISYEVDKLLTYFTKDLTKKEAKIYNRLTSIKIESLPTLITMK
jgi:hypothetical protein